MSTFTSILLNTDFVNDTKIANNQFTDGVIDECIVRNQQRFLTLLLGDDLYLKFGGELPTPTREEYTELLNGVVYVDPNDSLSRNVDFVGIKKMLRYFTYYDCVINSGFEHSIVGITTGSSRNALTADRAVVNGLAENKYNEAVNLYNAAFKFIDDIQDQSYATTSIVDNVDGTFTVNLTSTKYILNGDTVTINGTDYVVSSVVVDTSFDINETIGTVFPATGPVKFELFPTVENTKIEKLYFNGTF